MSNKYYRTQQHCYKVSYDKSITKVGKLDVNIATSAAAHIPQPRHAKRGHMQCVLGQLSLGDSLIDRGVQMRRRAGSVCRKPVVGGDSDGC